MWGEWTEYEHQGAHVPNELDLEKKNKLDLKKKKKRRSDHVGLLAIVRRMVGNRPGVLGSRVT